MRRCRIPTRLVVADPGHRKAEHCSQSFKWWSWRKEGLARLVEGLQLAGDES